MLTWRHVQCSIFLSKAHCKSFTFELKNNVYDKILDMFNTISYQQ